MGQEEVRDGKVKVDEGRRKLIKAAAVAGGAAVAVGALPGDWKKPLATVGGLPAHAQTSDAPIQVDNFRLGALPDARSSVSTENDITPVPVIGRFDYQDPLCQIDDTATLWVDVGPCWGMLDFTQSLSQNGAVIHGTRCAGTIDFDFNACGYGNSSIQLRLSKGSRHSPILNGTFYLLD